MPDAAPDRLLRERSGKEALADDGRKLGLAVDEAPGGTVPAELNGRIRYPNPAFCWLTGAGTPPLRATSLGALVSSGVVATTDRTAFRAGLGPRSWPSADDRLTMRRPGSTTKAATGDGGGDAADGGASDGRPGLRPDLVAGTIQEAKQRVEIDRLLAARERRGVTTLLGARALFVLVLAVPDVLMAYRPLFAILPLLSGLAWIAANGFLYWRLRNGASPTVIGFAGLILDLVVLFAFMATAGLDLFPDEVPVAIYTHVGLPLFLTALIVLHGMALRPIYPAIVTVCGLIAAGYGIWHANHVGHDGMMADMPPALMRQIDVGLMVLIAAVGAGVTYTAHAARRLLTDGIRAEAANGLMRRYFSPQVVHGLEEGHRASPLEETSGRVLETAVMFCDIRGFTQATEHMAPAEVMGFLTSYHAAMIDVIFEHGGTIDKFIGDAIMVTFGTPQPGPDDADRAVAAGMAMMAALDRLNARRAERGEPPIAHDIAIHFGPVIAGSIGTDARREYTVLGDVVNTASRMEGLCTVLDEPFLISADLADRLADPPRLRRLDPLPIRGRDQVLSLVAVEWHARVPAAPDKVDAAIDTTTA